MKKLSRNPSWSIWLLLIFIALATALLDFFTPLTGDDLSFHSFMLRKDNILHGIASFFLGHYLGCNGRFLDFLGPAIYEVLPPGVGSLLMGLMAALYFYALLLASRLIRPRGVAASFLVVAVMLAILPWWDWMWLRVCQFNYLWSATFALIFVAWFGNATRWWPLAVVGFLAASAHELTGVSLCGAYAVYLFTRRRYRALARPDWCALASLPLGTLFVIASPALYFRLGQEVEAYPYGPLVLSTLSVVVLLLVVIAVMLCSPSGRHRLSLLWATPWAVCVLVAVFSSVVVIYSDIPGRTGWVSQSFAAVSLVLLMPHPHIRRLTASLIICVSAIWIAVHYCVSVCEQCRVAQEMSRVLEAYIAADSPYVVFDATDRYEVNPLTLWRVKGVPDADDSWLRHVYAVTYASADRPFVILTPKGRVIDALPPQAVRFDDDSFLVGDSVINATCVDSVFIISPLIVDPGDVRPVPLP